MTWNFPDIKLGLELEVIDFGITKINFSNSKWGRTMDGSLSEGGREYVSKPLIGNEIPYQVEQLCNAFSQSQCEVDQTCGLHIHANFSDCEYDEMIRLYKVCKAMYPLMKNICSSRADNKY